MQTETTIEVRGAVCGTLWMPAVQGWRQERKAFTLRGPDRPFRPRVESIREALERVAAEDGDFQTAGKLTADTCFVVAKTRGNRTVRRIYYVDSFPRALAELVDFDCFQDCEE